jgi:chromosome segregation ATPase
VCGCQARHRKRQRPISRPIREKNRQLAQQTSRILEHEREIADLKQQLQSTKSAIADIAALKAALAEMPRKSATVAIK